MRSRHPPPPDCFLSITGSHSGSHQEKCIKTDAPLIQIWVEFLNVKINSNERILDKQIVNY